MLDIRVDHTTTYASVKKPTPATKQTLMWNHLQCEVRRVWRARGVDEREGSVVDFGEGNPTLLIEVDVVGLSGRDLAVG